MLTCKICDYSFKNKRSLSTHITLTHKIKVIDYVVQYIHDGIRPLCFTCNKETRYTGQTFKKYCIEHSYLAEHEGGRKGGQAKAWNKGLTKACDVRIALQAESIKCENNPFYGKRHTQETITKIRTTKLLSRSDFAKRITECSNDFELLTTYNNYFSRQQQYLELRCKKCDTILEKTLQTLERGTVCHICFPSSSSNAEREIYEYIISLGIKDVKANVKYIISPKELDIYIPSKNLAIEYNGLYWHSDMNDINKYAHKNKTKACNEKGILLLHIFSDEWEQKQEICKSIIQHKLKIAKRRIYARKCEIRQLDKNKAKQFLQRCHISGSAKCKIAFGLFYNDELVSVLTLRKPIQKRYNNTIEIARFANELYTHISGGFSKLLKYAIEWCDDSIKTIISYADLRFSDGSVYEKNNFICVKDTGISYWYNDGRKRFDRSAFKAKDRKSEAQIATENRVSKVYGCGSLLYEMRIRK